MPLTSHELIFLGLTAFAAFVGVRLASRGKLDTAGIARLGQKIDSILTHLGLTGYSVPTANGPSANAPAAGTGSTYNTFVTEEIMNLVRRGKKTEAINLYRQQNPGMHLVDAKNAIEQIQRTGM